MTSRQRLSLDRAAALLYADPRPEPLLHQLLACSAELVGAAAASISMINSDGCRYVKLAERGASCRLGQSFPVDEGATGQVVARRRPVVLGSYREIPHGHLDGGDAATSGAVAAIPMWWRGELVGANVLFAGTTRRFTVAEIDDLEKLTQLAAAGLAPVGAEDVTLSQLIRDRSRSAGPGTTPDGTAAVDTVVTEVGSVRRVAPSVAQVALDLVGLAERAAVTRPGIPELHVAVVHRAAGLRLLVHDAHAATTSASPSGAAASDRPADAPTWQELADTAGGGVSVDHVPGWGTLVRADLPYSDDGNGSTATPSPFTRREHQVLQLLAEGAGDKMIARRLLISQRTVEKHVGAVLRKTGAPSRTAAVVRALEHRWLVDPPAPLHH